MEIKRNKSLIREIAPGVIVIGNNPFAPLLRLDQIAMKADILGGGVLMDGALDDIEGESLDYNSAEIDTAVFANRPTALGVPIMVSGDLDYPISLIETDVTNLELSIAGLDDEIDAEETARTGNVQSIDIRIGIEETARGDNVASLDTRVGIEETARGDNVQSIDTRFLDLPSGGGDSGVSVAQAEDIAKKWAIILG